MPNSGANTPLLGGQPINMSGAVAARALFLFNSSLAEGAMPDAGFNDLVRGMKASLRELAKQTPTQPAEFRRSKICLCWPGCTAVSGSGSGSGSGKFVLA